VKRSFKSGTPDDNGDEEDQKTDWRQIFADPDPIFADSRIGKNTNTDTDTDTRYSILS
jgi:hypothetical protein